MVSWFEFELVGVEANPYVEENSKKTKQGMVRTFIWGGCTVGE